MISDFVQKADALYCKWDAQEKEVRHGKNHEFFSYFRRHIEQDMLKGMILLVRRSPGLRDEFFYNNDFKSKIREKKMENSAG